jgi:hypothetical protein
MVTPGLEKLILCGKAFFKTFVAGGDKHTLTFGNDRFIIITDITYFPMNMITTDGVGSYNNQNTQVAIYGERGYNHYIFRNYNVVTAGAVKYEDFTSPIAINTYLLHEQQVGFSFCNAPYFINSSIGQADGANPGYAPPIDFGIDGLNPENVVLTMDAIGGGPIQNNFVTRPAAGNIESQQLRFPYDKQNAFSRPAGGTAFNNNYEYPILLVNYVEVIGNPNNISI